jgi:hypothetical protein
MSDFKVPSPAELQQHVSAFIAASPETISRGGRRPDVFQFDYLPRDIKAHLDRFVIEQTRRRRSSRSPSAITTITSAICARSPRKILRRRASWST